MAIENLNQFLVRYFAAHDCPILKNENGTLTVQLTEAMDKVLMNRPFYWHYMKKIGNTGEPKQLTLNANPEKQDEEGEQIHFGSPRLQQIFNHLHTNVKYTRLFQQLDTTRKTALYPWLVINVKISYIGKQKKDELLSIGLQLVNGMMKFSMMDHLKKLPLSKTISDYCFTISPLIKLNSGFKRIESVLDHHTEQQDKDWALKAIDTWREEQTMLEHFYQETSDEEQQTQMEKEMQEIEKRYLPKISYQVINGGLFYLEERAIV